MRQRGERMKMKEGDKTEKDRVVVGGVERKKWRDGWF